MRGGEDLLVFPRALVGAERLIFVGDVDELDAGEAGPEVNVDLMRNGRRADKADAAQVRTRARSSSSSCLKLMMTAFGYSSFGTMKTGKQRTLVMAEFICANGSDSGPPSRYGSPSMGTRTAPFSN